MQLNDKDNNSNTAEEKERKMSKHLMKMTELDY